MTGADKSFIVTLKKGVPETEAKKFTKSVQDFGGTIVQKFSLFDGYHIKVPEVMHIKKLREVHGDVIASVEEDQEVHTAKK